MKMSNRNENRTKKNGCAARHDEQVKKRSDQQEKYMKQKKTERYKFHFQLLFYSQAK